MLSKHSVILSLTSSKTGCGVRLSLTVPWTSLSFQPEDQETIELLASGYQCHVAPSGNMADITCETSVMTVAMVIGDDDRDGKKILNSLMEISTALQAHATLVTDEMLGTDAGQVSVQTADVAVINMSKLSQWSTLFYHVGARESLGRRKNLLLVNEEQLPRLREVLEKPNVPKPTYDLLVYSIQEGGTIAVAKKDGEFYTELRKLLQSLLAGARGGHPMGHRRASLYSAKSEDDSSIEDQLTRHFYHLFIAARKAQNYEQIINTAERLMVLPGNENIMEIPKIGYPYAFALAWRKKAGDREKALAELERLLESTVVASEKANIACLCGRIFKDKFVESNYTDQRSQETSVNWYRRAFHIDPTAFSGINLMTLLTASGTEETTVESFCIGVLVSYWLGRVGSFSSSHVYWDLATALELGVAFEDYSMAIRAAEKIHDIKPTTWCLQSTLKNIDILQHSRPLKESAQSIILSSWIALFKNSLTHK